MDDGRQAIGIILTALSSVAHRPSPIVHLSSSFSRRFQPREAITYRALGEYVARLLGVVVELFAQAAYICFQVIGVATVFVAPYPAQKHIERQYSPCIAHQLVQKL